MHHYSRVVLIFLFFYPVFVFSQEKVRSVEYNGKACFIYPYKYSNQSSYYNYDGTYSYNKPADREIVPYPGELPDGEYLMYYEPLSRYKRKRWFFHRRGEYYYDTTVVAVTFGIKNNKKEGKAVYYSEYNFKQEEGFYQNDVREGIWMKISWKSVHADRELLNAESQNKYSYAYDGTVYRQLIEETEYKKGIKDGKYRAYIDNKDGDTSFVVSRGFYKENKETGTWREYFTNKKTAVEYTLTDSLGDPVLLSATNYSYTYNGNAGGQIFHNWYYSYYSNGQLSNRKLYKYGRQAQLDTGYFYDGKYSWVSKVYEQPADSGVYVFYDVTRYDTLGKLQSHSLERNGIKLYQKNYFEGKLTSETYYKDYYNNIRNYDTLVPVYISYSWEEGGPSDEIAEITYKHLETDISLHRKIKSDDYYDYNDMDDFIFRRDTASKIYYVEAIKYRGKNKELEFHSFSHYFRGPYFDYFKNYSSESDSVLLLINKNPYTGSYKKLAGDWRKKSEKVKLKRNKVKYFTQDYEGRNYYGGYNFGYSSKKMIAFENDRRYRRGFLRRIFRRRISESESGNYMDGFMQGQWLIRNKRKGVIYEKTNYNHGALHGPQYYYETEIADRWSECRDIIDKKFVKKTGLLRKGRYYLIDHEYYENNEQNGMQYSYHCNGRLAGKTEYQNNYNHGISEEYNEEGNLIKKTSYDHGYYNGKYQEWSNNGKLRYDLNFEEGVLVGEYKYFLFSGKLSYEGRLEEGYKTGDWITYFDDGQIKYRETFLIEDSSYFMFGGSLYGYHSKRPENFEHNSTTCYSNQYYPTGTLAAEGKIVRNVRKGIWKFYDEGGNLIKQINYEPGKIIQQRANGKTDTLNHYGYYESWYADGRKQSEAYVLSESSKFDCYQQVNISMQDLHYNNYWNKSGEQTIKEKSGRLLAYHFSTGSPESEGEIKNGLKVGYWRYWDPQGKLNQVGNYKDGEKDGKWLFGDLEGMHYLDDACFDITDPRVIEEMESKKKKLTIYEVFFKEGKIIKQTNFNVDLNPLEEKK